MGEESQELHTSGAASSCTHVSRGPRCLFHAQEAHYPSMCDPGLDAFAYPKCTFQSAKGKCKGNYR